MKTSQKSVFNPYETHILSRLNFFGAVHNFLGVLKKKSSFSSKPKMASLRFY
jgi:hypothetical protein